MSQSNGHTRCLQCGCTTPLVSGLCEPCYRTSYITPLLSERDKLIQLMSKLTTDVCLHEAKLKAARSEYNRAAALPQWRCETCKQVFAYYGDLTAHVEERKCAKPATRPTGRSRFTEVY